VLAVLAGGVFQFALGGCENGGPGSRQAEARRAAVALDAPPAGRLADGAADGGADRNGALVTTAVVPEARGLDSLLLAEAYERAARFPRIQSLLVARHGDLLGEQYFNGASAQRVANIKSASKSVISTLVGIAIAEGHLDGLDQPVLPFFPELADVNPDPRIHQVTIGDLLSMRAGLESTSSRNYGAWAASGNWVRDALRRPFVEEPGGTMVYSTGNTHVLSAILTRATGESTLAYARRVLFQPMGITLSPWTRDPQGVYLGGNEMGLRPREMLVYGELYRNQGRHEGTRLLSAEWIRDSWVQRGTSRFNGHGHGLGWWIREYAGRDVYFAWGHGGQYVFVVPELEMVVVATTNPAGGRQGAPTRALHDLLQDVLIPAAEKGAGGTEAPLPRTL